MIGSAGFTSQLMSVGLVQSAGVWTSAADQTGGNLWQIIGLVGPLVFAAILLFFLVRAAARQGRYRVSREFNDADRGAVREAIAAAERRTVGEILPVVVERSDPHPAAEWLSALCFLLVGSSLLAAWIPWNQPALVLTAQLLMGAVGFALARVLPDFKRLFVFEDRATAVAREQAFQEFYANDLHETEAATCVLLFVSLFEHRVIILADDGIDSVVDAEFWADTDDVILDGIREGSLRDGLIAGVRRAGERLAEAFPWREGDRNEIPDRVIVRRE
jgi:putative membrane protein